MWYLFKIKLTIEKVEPAEFAMDTQIFANSGLYGDNSIIFSEMLESIL